MIPTQAQVLAAQAKLALDEKLGRPSDQWVVDLAKSDYVTEDGTWVGAETEVLDKPVVELRRVPSGSWVRRIIRRSGGARQGREVASRTSQHLRDLIESLEDVTEAKIDIGGMRIEKRHGIVSVSSLSEADSTGVNSDRNPKSGNEPGPITSDSP
jgi:hypothetical protein